MTSISSNHNSYFLVRLLAQILVKWHMKIDVGVGLRVFFWKSSFLEQTTYQNGCVWSLQVWLLIKFYLKIFLDPKMG